MGCWSPPPVTLGIGITVRKSRDAELSVQVPSFAANPQIPSLSPTSYLLNSSSIIMAGRKTLLAPIHFIFSLLQKRSTVSIWLYEQLAFRIEGKIRVSSEELNPLLLRRTPG